MWTTAIAAKIMSAHRRDHFADAIVRAGVHIGSVAFQAASRMEVHERLQMLEGNWERYQAEHLLLVSDEAVTQELKDASIEDFQRIENEYLRLRLICRRLFHAFDQQEQDVRANQQPSPAVNDQRRQIIVQTADALANIPNTWGQFAGDYAQWHSFRDRFKAAVHLNQNLPVAFKFQYLRAAVVGPAARVLGTWELTDANYPRAWERLCEVYEDDYLAVQTLIRRLLNVPRMDRPTNSGLRRVIDTVHECMTQLGGFVRTESWDPILVFMVVELLDPKTHDAWEMHRADLRAGEHVADGRDVRMEHEDVPGAERAVVQIPSWEELRLFLERRARVLMHAERRERTNIYDSAVPRGRDSGQDRDKPKLRSVVVPVKHQQQPQVNRTTTYSRPCSYCKGDHPLYHCDGFKLIGLNAKMEHIENEGICKRCLPDDHPGRGCKQRVCLKCPNNQYHNTLICPTREAERLTVNLVSAGPSGGATNEAQPARRRRTDNPSVKRPIGRDGEA